MAVPATGWPRTPPPHHATADTTQPPIKSSTPCAVRKNFVCVYIQVIVVHFVLVRCSLLPFFCSHVLMFGRLYIARLATTLWARTSVHPTRPLRLITPPHLHLLMPAARLNTRLERLRHRPPSFLRVPTTNTKCNLFPTRSDISSIAPPSGDTPVCLVLCPTWTAFAPP